MIYEESKNLWKLEKESFDKINKTDLEKELFDLIDELINSEIILYQDFIDAVIENLDNTFETDNIEKRKQQVQNMYSKVLEHFKRIKDERISEE